MIRSTPSTNRKRGAQCSARSRILRICVHILLCKPEQIWRWNAAGGWWCHAAGGGRLIPSSQNIKTRKSKERASSLPPSASVGRRARGGVQSGPFLGRILSFVFSAKEGKARDCTRTSSFVRYQEGGTHENGPSPTLDEILPNFPKKYELTTLDRVFDKKESGHGPPTDNTDDPE